MADKAGHALRIDGLAPQADKIELERHFGHYGDILDITLPRDRDFGFVRFSDEAAAENALANLDGQEICGNPVRVTIAQGSLPSPEARRARSGAYAFKCLAPENVVAAVIGKGGSNLHHIQDQMGAHLEFSPRGTYFPETQCRTITIRAHEAAAVENVLREILGRVVFMGNKFEDPGCICRQEGVFKFISLLARHASGSLLGRGGEDIKRLQSELHCYIEVEKTPPLVEDHQRVEIRGGEEEILAALKVVNEKVQGEAHQKWFPAWIASDPLGGHGGGRTSSPPRKMQRITRDADLPAPTPEELEAFRSKFPMDAGAWEFLRTIPGAIQAKVLQDFRPRPLRSNDEDYSALVTSFACSIAKRLGDDSVVFNRPRDRRRDDKDDEGPEVLPPETAKAAFDDIFGQMPTEYLDCDYGLSCFLPVEKCKAIKECVAEVADLTNTHIRLEAAKEMKGMTCITITGRLPDAYNAHMRLMWAFQDGENPAPPAQDLQHIQEQIAKLQAQLELAKQQPSPRRDGKGGGKRKNGGP